MNIHTDFSLKLKVIFAADDVENIECYYTLKVTSCAQFNLLFRLDRKIFSYYSRILTISCSLMLLDTTSRILTKCVKNLKDDIAGFLCIVLFLL